MTAQLGAGHPGNPNGYTLLDAPGPPYEPPAAYPCGSCPYRRDVPSGVWAASEYARLPLFDRPTGEQPTGVFLCHQATGHVCAGWAGCHDMDQSLGLRFAEVRGFMTAEAVEATRDYVSPVPLFDTGAQAAAHGMADLPAPGEKAVAVARKIARRRGSGLLDPETLHERSPRV